MDGNLDHPRPSRVQDADEGLGDARLDRISESRASAGVESDAQPPAQGGGDGDQDGEARFAKPPFDQRQGAVVDPGHLGKSPLGQPRIQPHAANLRTDADAEFTTDAARGRARGLPGVLRSVAQA